MGISRRITRSQQKKQSQVGHNSASEGQSNEGQSNEDQTSSDNDGPEQLGKKWPTVKRSTVMAVVVEKRKKEVEVEAGKEEKVVRKEEREDEEAKDEVNSVTRRDGVVENGKGDSGEKVGRVGNINNGNDTHTKIDDNEGESITGKATAILEGKSDVSGKTDQILVETPLPQDDNGRSDNDDDDDDDDDDAPEALLISTGRQAILSHEAEVRRTQDSQKVATRLKRKALDTRLKLQKAQAKLQLPPPKRQKLSSTTTSTTTEEVHSACSRPLSTPPASTLQLLHSADSPPPPGILSSGSSTTLSHQPPPLSPTRPPDFLRTRRIPLLPDSLLEEVSRLPLPSAPSAVKAPHKLSNTRKKFSDFEAEEKAALLALEKKRKGNKLPIFKKGPVTVAVLGMEEHWERERRVMAPPGSFTVKNIKQSWLMGRKLADGERRPIGGKSFVRK